MAGRPGFPLSSFALDTGRETGVCGQRHDRLGDPPSSESAEDSGEGGSEGEYNDAMTKFDSSRPWAIEVDDARRGNRELCWGVEIGRAHV